ncbi:MAG TPA: hypothetical protein VIJ00_19895 [Nakamurella sp.]
MSLLRQRWRRDPRRRPDPLVRLGAEPFPAGDLVLLCAFGPDLARACTHLELSHALLQAGYDGPLTRHLIATSPMLRRHGNHYVLQRFTVV